MPISQLIPMTSGFVKRRGSGKCDFWHQREPLYQQPKARLLGAFLAVPPHLCHLTHQTSGTATQFENRLEPAKLLYPGTLGIWSGVCAMGRITSHFNKFKS
eukprot:934372-Rhodomonas_salina.1